VDKRDSNMVQVSTIYRILHPMTAEYPWNFHQDHILSHKTDLNKFKRIKIIQSAFCDHNGPKLENSNRMTTGKPCNTMGGGGGEKHF